MKIGIYCHIGHRCGRGILDGFRALGHDAVIRTAKYWRGEIEDFDLVVVGGAHSGRKVAKAYAEHGTDVLCFDWGYVKRVNSPEEHLEGHWQVGVGTLNSIAPFDCPADRFEALGVEIQEAGGDPDGYVLVCGQVPLDAAHGLGYEGYRKWLLGTLAKYPECVYRPHPRGGMCLTHTRISRGPLEHALAGARLVVTYNSNVGHDALLAGVPVIADGQTAYKPLEGEQLPSLEARRAHFHRVAYSQWTIGELRTGEPQQFWLDNLIGQKVEPTMEQRPDDSELGQQADGQGLEPVDERATLAAEYEARFGKPPHPRMKAETMRAKLEAAA